MPWKYDADNEILLGSDGLAIGHIEPASGLLVAAAPDMLEALKAVVAVADRKTVEFDMARAAIAKGEGR